MQLKGKKKKKRFDRTCQKWFAKFCAGDFSLDDTPQSDKPVEVVSNQIKTVENNQGYTTWETRQHTQNIQLFKIN